MTSQPNSTAEPRTPQPCAAASSTDEALLAGLLANSGPAWQEFERRYGRLLYSCIGRVLRRFRKVASDDDIREVYATLCIQLLANDKHKLRSFDVSRGAKLSTWLGLLATHTAYDYLRSVRREPERTTLTEALSLSGEEPDPCEATIWRQQARQVKSLLVGLSEKDQEFMLLYFGEGLSPESIASRMGINIKTVYSKKHKIRTRLESLMTEEALAA